MPRKQAKKTASSRRAVPKAAKGITKVSKKGKKTTTKLPVVLPEAALKALEAERSRLLRQLQPLQALQQKLNRINDQIEQRQKARSLAQQACKPVEPAPPGKGRKAARKGKSAKVDAIAEPLSLIDAPSDVIHAILRLMPSKPLILLSMTSKKALAVIDNAPPELCLWSDSLVVEKCNDFRPFYWWGQRPSITPKIKLEDKWEEHSGKEATEWNLAGQNSLNIRSNLLFPRALGETIRFKKRHSYDVFSGRVTKVIAAEQQEGCQGLDRVLLDAGEKGLHVLTALESLSELPPRVSAALALANKCLMCCKKVSESRSVLSPSFPPSKRILCQACFSDCTVSRKYVKKEMNVYADQLRELQNLPFATVKRDEAVLKEDVAGLYQTTWELFVKDTAARAIQRKQERKKKKEELKQQQKEAERARIKEATDMAKRLAKFAGPLASSSNNFRVTASGRIAGLLTGTPTFSNLVSRKTEVKKLLSTLERGSSSAQKTFQEQVSRQMLELRFDIISKNLKTGELCESRQQADYIDEIISGYADDVEDKLGLKITLTGTSPEEYKIASCSCIWDNLSANLRDKLRLNVDLHNSFCEEDEDCKFCQTALRDRQFWNIAPRLPRTPKWQKSITSLLPAASEPGS